METDCPPEILSLSEQQKIKIALQTIISGKLKQNHDETLLEKFCSFLTEFNSHLLEKIIIEESLFDLIDSHLDRLVIDFDLNETNLSHLVPIIDQLIISFRIGKSLLVHENIFKLYMETRSQQNLLTLLWKIFKNDPIYSLEKKNLLKITLFSFLNNICRHEIGKCYLFNQLIFNDNTSEECWFIEKIFAYYDPFDNTYYVQNEIDQLLASIIAMISDYIGDNQRVIFDKLKESSPSKRKELAKQCKGDYLRMILRENLNEKVFQKQPKLLLKIIDLVPNAKNFLYSFKIVHLIETVWNNHPINNVQFKYDLPTLNDWGRLMQLLRKHLEENEHYKLEPVINTILLNLLKQDDCFLYSTFLYWLINFGSWYEHKFVTFIQNYLQMLHTYYCPEISPNSNPPGELSSEEHSIIQKTFCRISISQFQTQFFMQLKQQSLSSQSQELIISHMSSILICSINFTNRKDFNLLITFLEQVLISCQSNNEILQEKISSLYLKLYCDIPTYRKCILKSIFDVTKKKSWFHFKTIVPYLNEHMKNYISKINRDDDEDSNDLLELMVELVYIIILNNCQGFQMELLNTFLHLEYSIIANDDSMNMIDDLCRVNIISTLFLVYYQQTFHKTFSINFLDDKFFDRIMNIDQEHLDYRQHFFVNMKDILQYHPSISFDQYKRLMWLCCRAGLNEFDIELQLILFNLIEFILDQQLSDQQTMELIKNSGFIQMIYIIVKQETFLPLQIEIAAMNSFHKYKDKIKSNFPDQIESKFGIGFKDAFEYLSNHRQEDNDKMKSIMPYLNLLDDIINTSTMTNDEIFKQMDCY